MFYKNKTLSPQNETKAKIPWYHSNCINNNDGIVAGDPDKKLEVIASVTPEQIQAMKQFMDEVPIEIEHIDKGCTFDIVVIVHHKDEYAKVRIANYHTNIVLIEKNGEILEQAKVSGDSEDGLTDRNLLDMEHIWDFAMTVEIDEVKALLDQQISCNMTIADEGLKNDSAQTSVKFSWRWTATMYASRQRQWLPQVPTRE